MSLEAEILDAEAAHACANGRAATCEIVARDVGRYAGLGAGVWRFRGASVFAERRNTARLQGASGQQIQTPLSDVQGFKLIFNRRLKLRWNS